MPDLQQRRRIISRCERFVVSWSAPRDPAVEFRGLADRAGSRLDVYGGGESVERLEARVAELLGKDGCSVPEWHDGAADRSPDLV